MEAQRADSFVTVRLLKTDRPGRCHHVGKVGSFISRPSQANKLVKEDTKQPEQSQATPCFTEVFAKCGAVSFWRRGMQMDVGALQALPVRVVI